jgi:hypothetical protein
MSQSADALINVITKMVGKKITGVVATPDNDAVGFTLSDGTAVWIDSDMEGNGIGWLSVEKMK